jgi:Putative addiction module component
MNTRIHHLLDEMLALKHEERSALILALLDGQEEQEPDPVVMLAWKKVALERLSALDSGAEKPVPWPEVKARLLAL